MLRLLFALSAFTLLIPQVSVGKGRIITDSSPIELRNFSQEALKEYTADRDFNYGHMTIDASPSLWDRFWEWFWSLFENIYSDAASGGIFTYIFIGLGCAAIVFAIVKLIGMDAKFIFGGASRAIEIPFTESPENIHLISLDQEIRAAAEKKNYRLAVRLMYLKALKKLSDSGKISWKPGKTNSEYIREIRNEGQKSVFKSLTRQFEYVWYGSFPVNDELFARLSNSFNDFYSGRYQ